MVDPVSKLMLLANSLSKAYVLSKTHCMGEALMI